MNWLTRSPLTGGRQVSMPRWRPWLNSGSSSHSSQPESMPMTYGDCVRLDLTMSVSRAVSRSLPTSITSIEWPRGLASITKIGSNPTGGLRKPQSTESGTVPPSHSRWGSTTRGVNMAQGAGPKPISSGEWLVDPSELVPADVIVAASRCEVIHHSLARMRPWLGVIDVAFGCGHTAPGKHTGSVTGPDCPGLGSVGPPSSCAIVDR